MLYHKLKINEKLLRELAQLGVVDAHWIRDIQIFEEFHRARKNTDCSKHIIYSHLAFKFGVKKETIRKVVYSLSK
jgi:hypothetical protein